jgi:hypothetical protein
MAKDTYALVLDAVAGSVVASYDIMRGTKTQAVKAHKTWMSKIKRSDWITIPEDLPVNLRTSTAVSLRVVMIPAEVLRGKEIQKKYGGDPRRAAYLENLINGSRNFEKQFEERDSGPDLLDQGLKQ